jgi:hypothetical protein
MVAPFRDVTLSAEVAGRIATKADQCNEGNFVRQGTLLFTIDPRDYALEVSRLTEQVRQADADLRELEIDRATTDDLVKLAEEQLVLGQNEVDRLEKLIGGGIVTQSDLDLERRSVLSIRNQLLTTRKEQQLLTVRYTRLQSSRALAQLQLDKAQLDLQRTKVVAPMDGVVVSDLVEQDSYEQKGTQLVTIEDTSAVEIQCNLRMDDLYWLWSQRPMEPSAYDGSPQPSGGADSPSAAIGSATGFHIPRTPVTVVFHFAGMEDPRFVWRGVLDRYEGVGVEPSTRTVPCRVRVDQPGQVRRLPVGEPIPDPAMGDSWWSRREQPASDNSPLAVAPPSLIRGMFVTVVVHAGPPADIDLLVVPEQAVQPDRSIHVARADESEQYRCHIARGIRLVERMELPAGAAGEQGSYWLIDASRSSMTATDLVIVSPLAVANEGMLVELANAAAGERQ